MRIAIGAAHLGAAHEEAVVLVLGDRALLHRTRIARPAGAALELVGGRKQGLAATYAIERALALFPVQRARAGPLGAVLACHRERLGREQRLPLGLGFGDFGSGGGVGHGTSLSRLRAWGQLAIWGRRGRTARGGGRSTFCVLDVTGWDGFGKGGGGAGLDDRSAMEGLRRSSQE